MAVAQLAPALLVVLLPQPLLVLARVGLEGHMA